eukprot:CAMPEP_0182421566 /NCGR_PEP_ID=MMETSP1167-20130531/6977_1 /TAXON_ID=2988 /ORGANISM="Mallomonas Sp, Strain CCMP3275" /LENGTH=582 /DNA_ID=CAMNT_0024598815 /DNA_START=26 /DNA_END=1774 /DNA_ORIENTATION=+
MKVLKALALLYWYGSVIHVLGGPGDHRRKNDRCIEGMGKDSSYYPSRRRNYCLGVVKTVWDYSPNLNYGVYMDLTDDSIITYLNETSDYEFGSNLEFTDTNTYYKDLFQQFTWVPASASSAGYCNWTEIVESRKSNGFLGPELRGIVGDTLYVHVRGNLDDDVVPLIHAHGMSSYSSPQCYNASNTEGENNTGSLEFPLVSECVYRWFLNYSSGGREDMRMSTTVWSYIVDSPINDGSLTGPITVISPQFIASSSDAAGAVACDVDHDFYLYLCETDETQNRYFLENLQRNSFYLSLSEDEQAESLSNTTFLRSHVKYSLGGLSYESLSPSLGLLVKVGSNIRWHVMGHSYGTLYTPSHSFTLTWYGNSLEDESERYVDTVTVQERQWQSLDMTPYQPGEWSIRVLGRGAVGSSMRAVYRVVDPSILDRSSTPSSSSRTQRDDGPKHRYSRETEVMIQRVVTVSAAFLGISGLILGLAMYRSHIESRVMSFMGVSVIPTSTARYSDCCMSPFDDLTSMSTHPTTALVTSSVMPMVQVSTATVATDGNKNTHTPDTKTDMERRGDGNGDNEEGKEVMIKDSVA